tara:strand:+ start:1653 stop:2939 length:1287 start_codon:yes stop_codon:yes gene_type:complete
MSDAGVGAFDSGQGTFGFKATADGKVTLGNTSDDVLHITGTVEQEGTSFKISGDDARIKINGDTNSHPGLEFYENSTRKWIIFNNYGDDSLDFKTNSNTRMVINQDGTVGIGTQSPSTTLDVAGDVNFDGSAVFNESSADKDFRVESNHQTHMFYIDGGSNRIGIGTSSPQFTLDVQERTGVDAVLRMMGSTDVGIRLAADSDDSGENDNPYIEWYQDGQNSNSRNNRLVSVAMEGDAATTFTGSLGNAFFIDAFCPNADSSNLRTIQFANDSSNNGHSARMTIEGTNGYIGIWTSTPSHALEVAGQFKANEEAIFGTTSTNLGSGATSTLTPASSVHLLTATSITSGDMGMHTMTLADGTTAGQILKIILVTTTNNEPIMISTTNILGGSSFSAIAIENNKQGAAIEFIWTGSAWAVMGNNSLASVQ